MKAFGNVDIFSINRHQYYHWIPDQCHISKHVNVFPLVHLKYQNTSDLETIVLEGKVSMPSPTKLRIEFNDRMTQGCLVV